MKTFPISALFAGPQLTLESSIYRCNHCGQLFFVQESLDERDRVGLRAIPCPICKQSNFAVQLWQCGVVAIKASSEAARNLASYSLIQRDLTDVVAACNRMLEALKAAEVDELVCASLWTHALIKYARCFPKDSGKRPPLRRDLFAKHPRGDQPDLQKSHKYFLDYRSKHIAHSVNAFEQAAAGVLVSGPDERSKQVFDVGVLEYRVPYSMPPVITKLRELASGFLTVVEDEKASWSAALMSELKALPFAEIYKLPRLVLKADLRDPSKARKH